MRSSFAPRSFATRSSTRGGFVLTRTLNERERGERRRMGVLIAILALALVAGVIGALTDPARQTVGKVYTSPLSYISVQ